MTGSAFRCWTFQLSFILFLFVKERGEGPGEGVAGIEVFHTLADDVKRSPWSLNVVRIPV